MIILLSGHGGQTIPYHVEHNRRQHPSNTSNCISSTYAKVPAIVNMNIAMSTQGVPGSVNNKKNYHELPIFHDSTNHASYMEKQSNPGKFRLFKVRNSGNCQGY